MADDAKTKTPVTAAAAAPAMARGTVAKGRTVLAPTEERRIVGYGEGGVPLTRAVEKHFGPGQEVTLPQDEILHLRRAGFIVDPGAATVNYGSGPEYRQA